MNAWLEKRLNVPVPGRCAMHECVRLAAHDPDPEKEWRRCITCRHVTKKLMSARCEECLGTEHLDRWEVDQWIAEDERFRYWISHAPISRTPWR